MTQFGCVKYWLDLVRILNRLCLLNMKCVKYAEYVVINQIKIYMSYIYVGDERTPEPSLWNFRKTPSIVI